MYFEPFGDVRNAIAREKQLKRWRREKKVALIQRENPGFKDLTDKLCSDAVSAVAVVAPPSHQ